VRALILVSLLAACGGASLRSSAAPSEPAWVEPAWTELGPESFERARAENKLVLLSVQAGWCHWCHVMNAVTYRDPEVLRILQEHFVVIRAEGDARPDLAERYRDYAWPATVFFAPDGAELLALRGHRPPERFRAILRELIDARREGRALREETPSEPNADLEAVRASLVLQLDAAYDPERGGWGRGQRYPVSAPIEHAFFRAAVRGEREWRERALETLERYASLIDPVWGGMYQYSEGDVWDRPHYEKIVPVQAGAIRAFAEAYRATGERVWLERAEAVRGYVRAWLTAPDGAFYTSQDADLGHETTGEVFYALGDEERRALGAPRVDTHVYAASNGMLIEALAALAVASGDPETLAEATRAAERILRTHLRENGLFAHDAADRGLFYLADQARMFAAFVALHQASGDARWLDAAISLSDALVRELRDPTSGGFYAHTEDANAVGVFRERRVPIIENAIVARALGAVSRLRAGSHGELAAGALRACARPSELRAMGRMAGEYLLALEHARSGYVLLSVVGPDEPRTRALHDAALRFYDPTRLVELGRPGASRYDYPGEPAVFSCTHEACSMPVFDAAELGSAARTFLGR
jgi:uncharacterized protein YyaL (SSP411 family)